jgi:hypothetical protein
MTALGGERVQLLLIHDLGLDGGGQRHAPAALYPYRKDSRYPIIQEVGWAPETKRLDGKSFRLCQESNLDRPIVQSVARLYTD